MNAVFKVIYNEALKVFQAVSEVTRSRGKRASSGFGGQPIDFSVNNVKVNFSGVAAALLAAGFLGGMPASALAEDWEMSDSYTVNSDKTVDSITASNTEKTLTINSPYTLTISQLENGGKGSSIASAIQGTGTLTLDNVTLTVTDNSNSSFDGSIILSGNATVYAEHLTVFTGVKNESSSAGRIEVGQYSKFIGGSKNIEQVSQEVYAQLSGSGRIELTENAGSTIRLMNANNDFHGFFSLRNGSLDWSDGAADFFSNTETVFTNLNLYAVSSVAFKSLVLNGLTRIYLRNKSTLALANDKNLNLSDETHIVGTGFVDALLTGDGPLLIGNGVNATAVTLSAIGTHSYDGTITVSANSSLTIDGELIAGSLNVGSSGTVNLNGNARTEDVTGEGVINIGSGKTLTLSHEGTGDLGIPNVFTGVGTLNIDRTEVGKVTFTGDESNVSNVSFIKSQLSSSDKGTNELLANAVTANLGKGSVLTVDKDQNVNTLTLKGGGTLSFDGGTLTADTVDLTSGKLRFAAKAIDTDNFNVFRDSVQTQDLIVTTKAKGITGYAYSVTETSGLDASKITQEGKNVAELNWTKPSIVITLNDTKIFASFKLQSINLLDKAGIGYRIATDANQTLRTPLFGDGNVTFSSSAGSGSEVILTIDADNSYIGATYVKSDEDKGRITVTADHDKAFGKTNLLSIGTNGSVVIADGTTQTVGGLEVSGGGKLNINGTLSLSGDQAGAVRSNNLITGKEALTGSGTLNLIDSTLKVEGTKNTDDRGMQNFSGTINIDRNSNLVLTGTELNDANALAKATISAADQSTITTDFHRDGVQQTLELNVKPQRESSKWNLVIAGKSSIKLDRRLEGLGSISFKKEGTGSPTLSTSDAATLGDAVINLNNGTLVINTDSNLSIANAITGDQTGKLELIGYNKDISFSGSGTKEFYGTVKAISAHLKRSGTWKQFSNAAVILTGEPGYDKAEYVVDEVAQSTDALKVRSLTANDRSMITFETDQNKNVQKLTVNEALVLESGSSVNLSPDAFYSIKNQTTDLNVINVLEQDMGSKAVLASAGSVLIADDVTITVENAAIAADQKTFDIAPNVQGTYGLSLDGANNTLSVVSKLESLDVKSGTLTLGTTADASDATLTAKITGSGGVTINSAKDVRLTNSANDFKGATNVDAGNLIVERNALGHTDSLNVNKERVVTIQGDQSHVQSLHVMGALSIEAGVFTVNEKEGITNTVSRLTTQVSEALSGSGSLTLTGKGSDVSGTNEGFSGAVTLGSDSTTTIHDATGLGRGDIEIYGTLSADLAANANDFESVFTGTGTFSVTSGSAKITSDISSFTGDGTKLGGRFVLGNGTAISVQSAEQKVALDVSGTDTGTGTFSFTGKGTQRTQVSFTNAAFNGTAEFTNTQILGSAYAASGSTLVLKDGSAYTADAKDLSLAGLTVDGSKLAFSSSAVPGTTETENLLKVNGALEFKANSTVDVASGIIQKLTLEKGQGNLLEQDDNAEHAITLATASGGVINVENAKLTVDRTEVTGGEQTFKIGADPNNIDAIGTYGYKLSDANNKLAVTYGLKALEVTEGRSITLGQYGDGDSKLDAKISGLGGITIDTIMDVGLTNSKNSYEGATNVVKGNLSVGAGALGHTDSLNANENSVVMIVGDQVGVKSLNVQGELKIISGTFTVNEKEGITNTVSRLTTQVSEALSGSGSLTLTGKGSDVSGTNEGFSGAVTLGSDSTTTIHDATGLGLGNIEINGTLSADLSDKNAGSDFENGFSGTGTLKLTAGDASITSDISSYKGSFDLEGGTSLSVSSDSTQNPVTIKLGGSGDFSFTGKWDAPQQVHFNNGEYTGTATFSKASISGKEYAASSSTLALTDGSTYTADESGLKLGGLSLKDSNLVFTSAAVPGTDETETALTVADSLTLNKVTVTVGKDVVDGLSTVAGKGNLLEQDEGGDKVMLATGKSVSVTGSSLQVVDKDNNVSTDEEQIFEIKQDNKNENEIYGKYGYVLGNNNTDLFASYALKEIEVRTGTLKLGTTSTDASATMLSASITGSGGVTIDS